MKLLAAENTPVATLIGKRAENAITLWGLLSALVIIVRIVATDIASETRFSLWAVTLSVVGVIWS